MKKTSKVICFFKDETGLTLVEYVVGAGVMIIGFATLIFSFKDILIAELASVWD